MSNHWESTRPSEYMSNHCVHTTSHQFTILLFVSYQPRNLRRWSKSQNNKPRVKFNPKVLPIVHISHLNSSHYKAVFSANPAINIAWGFLKTPPQAADTLLEAPSMLHFSQSRGWGCHITSLVEGAREGWTKNLKLLRILKSFMEEC
jgi:hypothetical protein